MQTKNPFKEIAPFRDTITPNLQQTKSYDDIYEIIIKFDKSNATYRPD